MGSFAAEEKMHENEKIELSDFLEEDERLETEGSFSLEEIAEEMLGSKEPVENKDDTVTIEEKTFRSKMPSGHGALLGSSCSSEAGNWV